MRFAITHKTTTYLMVVFAYLALTTGGGIAPPLALGGFAAIVVSWWWEPPLVRFERWSWVWTGLSVLALAYSVLGAIATGDFLGVGGQFLIWLVIAKLFNRRAAKDWQQLYLLAFLMVIAGSVLNPELTYGLSFLGFVVCTTWALTLFHLRREIEDNLLVKHAADRRSERVEVRRILDSRRIIGGRFLAGTALLSFAAFLAAAVIFLSLPRVGFGFFLKTRGGLTLAGFSDGVKLGGHGVIKNDPTVVMRVQIESKVGSRAAPSIHWRGVAFDQYADGRWTRGPRSPRTQQTLETTATRDRRVLLWAGKSIPVPAIEALATASVKQDIWLDPLDSDVLFGASNPRIVEYAHVVRRRPAGERNDEIRLDHGSTLHYQVWSELDPPSPDALRAATGPLPASYDVYTALPPEITARTRALAKQLTAGKATQYDRVLAIRDWLQANLTYTLELADPGRQEPVDHFLFDRKEGHCEYFASAFAVLARAAEPPIPVRNVNGFLGGEWNEYQGYVAVRAGDAHSWDEVFFPGVNGVGAWVTIDPTPPGDPLGRGGSGWRARLGRYLDTLKFQWSKWVIEYDLVSQLSLFKSIGSSVKDLARWVKTRAGTVVPIAGGLALALVGFAIWRRRRKRGARPGGGEGKLVPRRRSSIGEVYATVRTRLAAAGLGSVAGETPRELAARLRATGHAAAARVEELTELYYAAEWGDRTDAAAEARAQALAPEIRALVTGRAARR